MELWELSSEFNAIDVDHDTMAICNPQIREAALIYNAALDKVRFGKTAEARSDLRRATQLYPGFDDAYILLGLCVFASGNRIDAMRTFNQITNPEKHTLAMRYFDMLSASSKDMVSDYKKQQKYRGCCSTLLVLLMEMCSSLFFDFNLLTLGLKSTLFQ